jgi:hypothetical protein
MAAGWAGADLTGIARGALRLRQPVAFTTNLAGQGPVARVDYRTTAGGTEELSLP